MSRPTCAGKDTPVRGSSEILMVENVNTYGLPSEWIPASSYLILSGLRSVTGHPHLRRPMPDSYALFAFRDVAVGGSLAGLEFPTNRSDQILPDRTGVCSSVPRCWTRQFAEVTEWLTLGAGTSAQGVAAVGLPRGRGERGWRR